MSCTSCNKTYVSSASKLKLLGTNSCTTTCSSTFDICNHVRGSYFIVSVSVYRDEATFEYYIDQIVLTADTTYVSSFDSYPSLITLTDPTGAGHLFSHIGSGFYEYNGSSTGRLEITSEMAGDWTLLANELAFTLISGDSCCISVTFTFNLAVTFETPNVYAIDDSYIAEPETTLCMSITDNDVIEGGAAYTVAVTQPPQGGVLTVNNDSTPPTICYVGNAGFCGQDAYEYEITTEHGATDRAVVGVYVTCSPCIESSHIRYSKAPDFIRGLDGELYLTSFRIRPQLPPSFTLADSGVMTISDDQGAVRGTFSATSVSANDIITYSPDASAGESTILYAESISWAMRVDGLSVISEDGTVCTDLSVEGFFIEAMCDKLPYPQKDAWFTNAYIEEIPGTTSDQVRLCFYAYHYTTYLPYIATNPSDQEYLTGITVGNNHVIVNRTDLENGLINLYVVYTPKADLCYQIQPIIFTSDVIDNTQVVAAATRVTVKDFQHEGLGVNFTMLVTDLNDVGVASYNWTLAFDAEDTNTTTGSYTLSGLGQIPAGTTYSLVNSSGTTIETFAITGSYNSFTLTKTLDSSTVINVEVSGNGTMTDGSTTELSSSVTIPMQVIV